MGLRLVIIGAGGLGREACAWAQARQQLGAVRRADRFLELAEVEAVLEWEAPDHWHCYQTGRVAGHPLIRQLRQVEHPGLVLFTSGSTGESKAALHDFSRVLEQFQAPRPACRTITFLLFDHIGGLNTLFHVLANGGTFVVPEGRDAATIAGLIERHRVELLPTSPSFLNLFLLSETMAQHDLSSLRMVTYGTKPMPESTLRRLHQALPHATLAQTYGLSELGILRAKSRSSDSLWVRLGGEGYETRVIGEVLWIRARSAMLGYLNAPSPFDSEGWFNTGDEVEVDGEYIRILGRRTEVINVGGEKVHPAEVESVVQELPNIAEATVRGEANPLLGQVVVAEVVLKDPEDGWGVRRRIRDACKARLAGYKVPAKVVVAEHSRLNVRFKKIRRAACSQSQAGGGGYLTSETVS